MVAHELDKDSFSELFGSKRGTSSTEQEDKKRLRGVDKDLSLIVSITKAFERGRVLSPEEYLHFLGPHWDLKNYPEVTELKIIVASLLLKEEAESHAEHLRSEDRKNAWISKRIIELVDDTDYTRELLRKVIDIPGQDDLATALRESAGKTYMRFVLSRAQAELMIRNGEKDLKFILNAPESNHEPNTINYKPVWHEVYGNQVSSRLSRRKLLDLLTLEEIAHVMEEHMNGPLKGSLFIKMAFQEALKKAYARKIS